MIPQSSSRPDPAPPAGERRRPPPLDVLLVRPNFGQGGADRVTWTLLRHLDRDRFRPRLALFRSEGPYADRLPADVPVEELGAGSLWTAWWPLARALRRRPPALLFSTCSGTNVVACLAALMTRPRPRLVLSERNVLLRDQPWAKKWLLFAAKRALYGRADCVTAVSAGVADDLTGRLGVEQERVLVVSNPVVEDELERLAAEELVEPPYDAGVPVVLAAGRLVPAKGFDVLLDAFARVRGHRDCRLVVLGEGPERPRLARLADNLGLASRVYFPGFVANPFKYMARSTVFALSSRFEGLPGVLIQAMACGLPAVATDCHAGPREIIRSDGEGILVPVGDAAALAAAIGELLADPARRRRLAAAGRRRARAWAVAPAVERYSAALLAAADTAHDTTAARRDGAAR